MSTRYRPGGLSGPRGLCAAIVAQAAKDLETGAPPVRRDARAFFESAWFETLTDYLDLAPDVASELLEVEYAKDKD